MQSRSFFCYHNSVYLYTTTGVQPKTDPLSFWGTTRDRSPILLGYNLRQIPFGRRFLFAHICRNSLFIICSLQNSSYCLLSTISGIFTINALLQQPCAPFHFDKQASFATSTPTIFCLQTIKPIYPRNSEISFFSKQVNAEKILTIGLLQNHFIRPRLGRGQN